MEQIMEQFHRKNAGELCIPRNEIYRYLGYAGVMPDESIKEKVEECVDKLVEAAVPQSIYSLMPVKSLALPLDLTYGKVSSQALQKNLEGCTHTYVFAATIGPKVDMLIARYSKLDPVMGVICQATGAAIIEAYCDDLNNQLKEEMLEKGYSLKPRFSPGYGDLPLNFQKDIFGWLLGAKKIGLTLMDTLVMAPEKSVSAIIGVKPMLDGEKVEEQTASCHCESCGKADCKYRIQGGIQ